MSTLDNFTINNQRFLVRVDFNVPMDSKRQITDDTRIRATLPTINKIISHGGKVILMSHRGRPKGKEDDLSMRHLVPHIEKLLGKTINFIDKCIGDEVEDLSNSLNSGEIMLIENLRFYEEEKKGDLSFAKALSKLGDVYVNDAFGTAHRAHASTSIVASFFGQNKCFGYVMSNEIDHISKITDNANKPFTAIVGGAKVSSKIAIIYRLLDLVDNLIIGGGMAYTFIKAMGGEIGNSLVEDDALTLANTILEEAQKRGVKIHLPVDSINADKFDSKANTECTDIDCISPNFMGLDVGPKSMSRFSDVILGSSTILWNGPMGVFEMAPFSKGTEAIAVSLAQASSNGAFTLVGGGDSVAAINAFGLADKVSYVTTGGGAMLEYLEGKVLPGIAAINRAE